MIVVKVNEIPTDNDFVRVEFSIGETVGNAFSFATEQAGILTMSPLAWKVFLSALQKGTRRPMLLMLEQTDG